MPTTYTTSLGLALPATGELSGTWGTTVNDYITKYVDAAVAGTQTLSTDADVTLTTTNGSNLGSTSAQYAILNCTGARTVQRTITVPATSKTYVVVNSTTGGQSVKVVGAGPTTGVTIANGERALIVWNGSDFTKVATFSGSGTFTDLTVTGNTILGDAVGDTVTVNGATTFTNAAPILTPLTASRAVFTDGSKALVSNAITGTGNVVMSASPTLTGTVGAASLTLSSLTSGRVTYAGASGLLQDSANLTFNGTTLTANTAAVSTGNLTFSGTAQRITGDMSNATIANRLAFQSSTTNGVTSLQAIPNGASTVSQFNFFSSTDPDNSSVLTVVNNGAEVSVRGNQTGTGTYLPMTFWTGGSERVRVDTSGNVGIGTASPGVKLDVSGAVNANNYQIQGSSATQAGTFGFLNSNGPALEVWGSSSANTGSMVLKTAGSERMRIDSSGNVGIGTTSPSFNLQVNGTVAAVNPFGNFTALQTATGTGYRWTLNNDATFRLQYTTNAFTSSTTPIIVDSSSKVSLVGNLEIGSNSILGGATSSSPAFNAGTAFNTGGASIVVRGTATGYNNGGIEFFTGSGATGNEAMRIDSSGNVGIGTTSPNTLLHLYAATNPVLRLAGGADAGLYIDYVASFGGNITVKSNQPLIFKTNDAERARIDSSGNVGIGTASPSYMLHLQQNGNTQVWVSATNAGSNSAGIGFENQGQRNWQIWADRTNDALQFGNNSRGTTNMVINSSGNVGIGTTSPGARLDVNGAVILRNGGGGEGGQLELYNPDNAAIGLVVDVSSADIGRIFSTRNNSVLEIGQLAGTGGIIKLSTAGSERMRITATGNIVAGGSVALATTATDGFLYVPTCAGTPTGTPTAITGMAPIVVDTTNNKLYFYSGGVWRDAGP